jgi:flagellar protein FlaI
MKLELLEKYDVTADRVPAEIFIIRDPDEFVLLYVLKIPAIERGTAALLDFIKERLIASIPITTTEIFDIATFQKVKRDFEEEARKLIKGRLPSISEEQLSILVGFLCHSMLGLGNIEILLKDDNLEEIVINSSKERIWVYHKKYGWLRTNIWVEDESQIQNYADLIGRKVGRSITILDPLMDAHLVTGDRVNATLFPISTIGNTLTIRKFRRRPWTITDFIQNRTVSIEASSLLWQAIEYELAIIFSGGTASGKTSFLNSLMPFIPPNQRIISIEDTRELSLPSFLHWVPLTTREASPEGKGEITMLDLLINSLRMRPDRIVVGEIRRQREAEVLFEALHTGHSVYATLHADTAEQAMRRLTSPPISLPEEMLITLPLIAVMYRHRRKGIRRLFEVVEIVEQRRRPELNLLYRWDAARDLIRKVGESRRLAEELHLHTGMSKQEMKADLKEKGEVLKWMVRKGVNTVEPVGKVVSTYYTDRSFVLKVVRKDGDPKEIVRERIEKVRVRKVKKPKVKKIKRRVKRKVRRKR